jgi:hypothetical protein
MRVVGAAVAADRMHDRLLALARTGPPPNRKRQRRHPLASDRNTETQPSHPDSTATLAGERALFKALTRAGELDRLAGFLLHLGYTRQAARLSHRARTIRGEVLA